MHSTSPAFTSLSPPPLVRQALAEAEAMASYALAQGNSVPCELLEALTQLRDELCNGSDCPNPGSDLPARPVASGVVRRLGQLHQRLARLVAPATPRTLLLIAEHREAAGRLQFLGPVRLLRQLIFLALAFLIALLALSLHPTMTAANVAAGFFEHAGLEHLFCQGFLLCAAGLGACFSALFEVNRYVGRGVYDPKYDASYWSRLVLGLMAGIMLAELVGPQFLQGASAAGDAGKAAGTTASAAFAKPTLALLGGFSASVVYRILQKLVRAVESLVTGELDPLVRQREEALRAQLGADGIEARLQLAQRLLVLQSSLASSPDAQARVVELLREFLSAEGETGANEGSEPQQDSGAVPAATTRAA
ncbi:MAG TPA: hypothetical protein VFS67_24835 [Polyangiaceae bacterium]|nr:hypothetical protein [Polyangiaceae bacterium]